MADPRLGSARKHTNTGGRRLLRAYWVDGVGQARMAKSRRGAILGVLTVHIMVRCCWCSGWSGQVSGLGKGRMIANNKGR